MVVGRQNWRTLGRRGEPRLANHLLDKGTQMLKLERHEMEFVSTHPTGGQEWQCTECARRIVMRHDPERSTLETIELNVGDRRAAHFGRRGGVEMSCVPRLEAQPGSEVPIGYLRH